jgi:hypothetical protein
MKSTDLTCDQVDKLLADVTPVLGYQSLLFEQMDRRGMGAETLADSVQNARNTMQELRMALHRQHSDGTRPASQQGEVTMHEHHARKLKQPDGSSVADIIAYLCPVDSPLLVSGLEPLAPFINTSTGVGLPLTRME